MRHVVALVVIVMVLSAPVWAQDNLPPPETGLSGLTSEPVAQRQEARGAEQLEQAKKYAREMGVSKDVIERFPSIVRISMSLHTLSAPFMEERGGSGFFVGTDASGMGLFFTASHVFLPYKDVLCGKSMITTISITGVKDLRGGRVVYYNAASDMAVIRTALDDLILESIPIADKDPEPGDELFVVGFPGVPNTNVDFLTLLSVRFRGSYRYSDFTVEPYGMVPYLVNQFLIFPGAEYGYSGGALLNKKGHLVGMPVWVSTHGVFSTAGARSHLLEALAAVRSGQNFCGQ